MANEKIFDQTKSAAANETSVNNKFNELSQQGGGGISLDDLKAQVTTGQYGSSTNANCDLDNPTRPSHLIEDVNTIRMIKDMKDSVMNISVQYGHEPNMVIHEGTAYIAFTYQRTGTGENWDAEDPADRPKTKLAIVNIATMQVLSTLTIAENGDTCIVDGATKTINTAGSPNIVLLNGIVRVVFSADGILYRDYNISTGVLGDIGTCYLSDGTTTATATKQHFQEMFNETTGGFGVNGQYALIDGTYYIAVVNGESGNNGNIFTTTDFITFTFWAKPSIPAIGESLGFEFEMALYPWIDVQGHVLLYFAMRRTRTLKNMIVGAIYTGLAYSVSSGIFLDDTQRTGHVAHTAGATVYYRLIPCNSLRPCFFSKAGSIDFEETRKQGTIYLTYDNAMQPYAYRQFTDIMYLNQNSLEGSYVGREAQCLTMTYPSVLYHDGYYYTAYQGKLYNDNQPHVLLSKFRPFDGNWDKVIAGLSKMLDTFEPSES